ncbi:ferritin-like domain-containing protein [Chitinivibrio alkaliphilus]|uniref:Rubrerythrin n=1 Tax=Chitinivibrio alkaliphilus ACht1 TaxID=1313304 RepID=U7DAC4_9BACT|nr:ferritin family protein [Chitinivibrio alkaliphilus]ERP31340.1 Rubrerythrin [Chitinivibrio alkaliphilus ACht1]
MQSVWNTAIEMENKGIAFFEARAKETKSEALAGIFTFLQNQEEKHRNFFMRISNSEPADMQSDDDAIAYARSAFDSLKDNFPALQEELEYSSEVYAQAKQMERDAIEFYTSLLDEAETEEQKRIIRVIIGEEEKHEQLMQAMMDFVARPQQWIENAEWNHLEAY